MNEKEKIIAQRAIKYMKKHGLYIEYNWRIRGNPPKEVADYLDGHIESCFPSDPDEVVEQIIDMIEMDMTG